MGLRATPSAPRHIRSRCIDPWTAKLSPTQSPVPPVETPRGVSAPPQASVEPCFIFSSCYQSVLNRSHPLKPIALQLSVTTDLMYTERCTLLASRFPEDISVDRTQMPQPSLTGMRGVLRPRQLHMLLLPALVLCVLHLTSREQWYELGDALSSSSNPSIDSLFPHIPAHFAPQPALPILTSRPNSTTSHLTRQPHLLPYPGTAYHISSAVHPSKEILDKTEYVLTSTWFFEQDGNADWMKRRVQMVLPSSLARATFTCEYASGVSGSRNIVQAKTKVQARKEYIYIECPLPSWVTLDRTMPESDIEAALAEFASGRTRVSAWSDIADLDEQATDPGKGSRHRPVPDDTRDSGSVSSTAGRFLLATQDLAPSDWQTSGTSHKLGVCVSPVHLQPVVDGNTTDLVSQLKDYIEWRIWHRLGGVDVVHWYARNHAFGSWVDTLNRVLGLQDTFVFAPIVSDTQVKYHKAYADQALYLAECLARRGVTDEWLAMTDLDEYIMARDDPAPFFILRRLEALPERVGSFAIDHTYFGGAPISPTPPVVGSFPRFPRNAWQSWDTLEAVDGYRRHKSIYRTAAVKAIWVHSHTEMGRGFWRTEDLPGIKPDKGEYPSQLELLHDRRPVPARLTLDRDVQTGQWERWEDFWRDLAKVLQHPALEELWDVAWGFSDE